jgi:replication factor A1
MEFSKDQLYERIQDLMTRKEFEKALLEKATEFDSLLDEETLALYLVDELGRNNHATTQIAELKQGEDATVEGHVVGIGDTREFSRKNGSKGKVVNLDLQDATGSCRVVLWNHDTDLIKTEQIQMGSTLKIINGYTKAGMSGLELHLGRWGLLKNSVPSQPSPVQKQQPIEITGELVAKEPTKAFFRDDGEFGFVTTIIVQGDEQEYHLVVWDKKVKEIQQLSLGDKVRISHLITKQKNGTPELHLNGQSGIQKL